MSKALPSVDSLRCFLAAATQLNFRRAAREVALTPTAFSERISGLEDALGQRLFARTSRRVELTDAGRTLVPVADRAVRGVQACVDVLAQPGARRVRIRVGTRFELGTSWLLPAVMKLEKQRPQWEVDLYCGASSDLLERLNGGLLDAIVTSAPVAGVDQIAQFLQPETYAFVTSPEQAKRSPVRDIGDCRAHTLLDLDQTLPLARYLISVTPGIEFSTVRLCGAGAIVLARVLAGDGVAVLPSYMVEREIAARRLVRLLPEVALLADSFRLISRRGAPMNAALGELAHHLRGCELR